MKKTLSLVTIIALVLTLCTSTCNVSAADFTPTTGKGNSKKATTTTTSTSVTLFGRFAVASVGIDVALYNSNSQAVCDAEDSASFFNNTIADHANQGFRAIRNIVVGNTATITRVDGTVITLVCAEAYDGHNTGHGIVDNNGVYVAGQHDYLSYTCLDSTGYDVHIVQWDIISDTANNITAPAPTKTKGNGNNKKNK